MSSSEYIQKICLSFKTEFKKKTFSSVLIYQKDKNITVPENIFKMIFAELTTL